MGPGPVTLPNSGLVYVDTQVIIYSVERHPDFGAALEPLWRAVQAGTVEAVTCELTALEVLVVPLRRNDTSLVARHEAFLVQPGVKVVPISRPILRRAAEPRAATSALRTPDAIHVATSLLESCSTFVTNDVKLRTIAGLSTILVRDLLPKLTP